VYLPLFAMENSLFKAIGDIFHPLFEAVAYSLAGIYSVVHTYGVAIIILTIVIMGLLTPLTIKSTRSMLAMQGIQPEMQKLRAKYKGAENRQQLNEEMMKLYREHGVSPTGGCLPMFLQMPALIVLYDTIRGLANTVKKGLKLGTGKKVCHKLICPTPRYVPHHSAIYKALVATPGVMHSLGLNLAAKPLTHRLHWVDYIPYFGLLAVAVGLQYFQMAQMTRRNQRNNPQQQIPQQMQTMQRIMPLIFAYIYFLVPAGVVIYMIVSSAIRVLTQDMIFRHGLVQLPGERQVGAKTRPAPGSAAIDVQGTSAAGQTSATSRGDGEGRLLPFGGRRSDGAPGPPAQGGGGVVANGRRQGARNGSTAGNTPPSPKAHPRSKSKRARKAR
jgi:YidC/Oxa1 family membrane protein insertase